VAPFPSRPDSALRRVRPAVLGMGLAALGAVLGCAPEAPGDPASAGTAPGTQASAEASAEASNEPSAERETPPAPRPDVVLLSIDTLRADHLDAYGYTRPTGSALDRYFVGAVTFRRAYSTSSWTAPALASLLTSLHPYQHGVRSGIAPMFLMGEPEVMLQQPLDPRHVRLPERLREAGYQTFGLSTNPHATAALGFDRGFDHFEFLAPETPDPESARVYADAAAAAEQVAAWKALRRDDAPSFLWVHLLDPHLPYHLREPWLERYRPRQIEPRRGPLPAFQGLGLDAQPLRVRHAALVSMYDAEIHFAAEQLASALERWGVDDETLLVLTSDHGESFFEHGKLGHAQSLYEPELRVPLRVRFPRSLGIEGGDPTTPVSLVDVMPTILELAGAPLPADAVGRSLLPAARGEAPGDRILLAELARRGESLHAAIQGRWKRIEDQRAGRVELYDLERDPTEHSDLAGRRPEVEARLAEALRAQREAVAASDPVEIPSELHTFLRSLGYVDLPEGEDAGPP